MPSNRKLLQANKRLKDRLETSRRVNARLARENEKQHDWIVRARAVIRRLKQELEDS